MQDARAPWWVFAVAAGVLGFLLLNTYAELFGPGAVGLDLHYQDGRAAVVSAVPGFPAARAGLRPGDVIVTADGQPIQSLFHWIGVLENAEVERPLRFAIERGPARSAASIELGEAWRGWSARNWVSFGMKLTAQLVTLSLALLIAIRRPHDRVALIVFDEAHRLADPARILKIGADAFPLLRLLATGSSTLSATRKVRDTLTGRKAILPLPPILWPECEVEFEVRDLNRRLLHGGLPEPLLANESDPSFYAEWLDSFYARDIQELFGIRERTGFLNLLRLMLRQSGGLVDYSALSRECDLSRATVKSHHEAMTVACALIPIPPFQHR